MDTDCRHGSGYGLYGMGRFLARDPMLREHVWKFPDIPQQPKEPPKILCATQESVLVGGWPKCNDFYVWGFDPIAQEFTSPSKAGAEWHRIRVNVAADAETENGELLEWKGAVMGARWMAVWAADGRAFQWRSGAGWSQVPGRWRQLATSGQASSVVHGISLLDGGQWWSWNVAHSESQKMHIAGMRSGGWESLAVAQTATLPDAHLPFSHVILLSREGRLWSLGRNHCGQLGTAQPDSDTPQLVEALQPLHVRQIACGAFHSVCTAQLSVQDSCADVYTFGWNRDGQLGHAPGEDAEPVAVDLVDDAQGNLVEVDVTQIDCGTRHSALIDAHGRLWTCGWNEYGQLGRPSSTQRDHNSQFRPVSRIPGRVTALACSATATICCATLE